ncbi:MAG: hypothetical protein KH347_05610 [Acetobacter sp.]|nr:hypothetical protein [Acetobacter sp.]
MNNRIFRQIAFFAAVGVLGGLFARNRAVYNAETTLLLPVEIASVVQKGAEKTVRLRYRTLIPPSAVSESGGKILVSKDGIGAVSFLSVYDPAKPLRTREYVLKYSIVYDKGVPAVRFGRTSLTVPAGTKENKAAYAVVKADKDGRTALIGLADKNGRAVKPM